MRPEEKAPWWSWAPRFPKKGILCAAGIYDAVAAATILRNLDKADSLKVWPSVENMLDASMADTITANAVAVGLLIQLHAEVFWMILTLKANYEEKKEAKAAGIAEGKAEGRAEGNAEAEAKFRAWYEAHKDKLQDAPPPPFSPNGNNGGGPY